MEIDISVENVCQFLIDHGGKVKNTFLVAQFKKYLNDPATKDAARHKFKECVNTVATVKTENGEKFVQLKKKYRAPSTPTSPDSNVDVSYSRGDSLEHSPSKSIGSDKSYNANEDVHKPVSGNVKQSLLEQTRPDESQRSPESKQKRNSKKKQDVSSVQVQPNVTQDKNLSKRSSRKGQEVSDHQRKDAHLPENRNKHGDLTSDSSSKTTNNKTILGYAASPTYEREPPKLDVPQISNENATFAVPAAVPLRKKKKENVPPSPNADQRWTSVDRVKTNTANQTPSSENRMSRIRPASYMPGSYAGSVERARQNFQNNKKQNDDSSSLAPSEKSLDSKGEELDDDDYRNIPSVALDMNEKSWIIRSAQGNLVEMRILLDLDSTLAEKKDFVMVRLFRNLKILQNSSKATALHWAAKKGNEEMVNMLLDQKVDVNCRSGYTPLHFAAMHGHESIISLLLDNKADRNIRDYNGHKPIYYLKSISLPLQRILFGNEPSQQGIIKDFAAGLRSRNPAVRKSQYRVSTAISGGFTSVGFLVPKPAEESNRYPETDPNVSKSVSTKSSKLGRMKKSKKLKDERPRISVVSIDDSDSGYVNRSNSSISGITLASVSSNYSIPASPARRPGGFRGSIDETY